MTEIHDGLLWIGHALDIRAPRPKFEAGISAVIDVAFEEKPAVLPRQLVYSRFPLNDGGGNEPDRLQQAIRLLVDLLVSGTPTLVGCSAGMSRSPTLAAFALAALLDQRPEDVISRIADKKSLEINGVFWSDVARVFPRIRR